MEEDLFGQDEHEEESRAHTGGQGQSQGGGGGGGMVPAIMNMREGGNSKSLPRIPLIFRIACLVLGLVAIILTCVAWGNATIFTLKEDYRTLVCPYDNKGDFLPSKENCSLQNLNQAQKCDNRNERYAAANKPLKICPSRWLVIPAMIIFGVTWFITSLLFIPLCICLLKNDGFFLLDLIGHAIAGAITIVSGLCILGYWLQVVSAKTCDFKNGNGKDEYDRMNQEARELDFWRRFGPDAPPDPPTSPSKSNTTSTRTGGDAPKGRSSGEITETARTWIENDCPVEEYNRYYHWWVFGGGLCVVLTGVLYILIVVLSVLSRKGSVRPQ